MKNVIIINRTSLIIYYLTIMIYEFARVLPHAVLTLILLDKGISLSGIAIIQSSFMISVILFEIPSGVWSDLYNRKLMYILSFFIMMISYFVVFFAQSFWLLCFAWFIYGFSSALRSGTIDIMFINYYKNNGMKNEVKSLMSNSRILTSVAGITSGVLGGFLYGKLSLGISIYKISIILFALAGVISLFYLPNDCRVNGYKSVQKNNLIIHIKNIINSLQNSNILYIILLLSLSQLFYQPFFNYWQDILSNKGLKVEYFGYVYILLRFSSITASYIFTKLSKQNKIIIYLIFSLLIVSLCNTIIDSAIWLFLIYIFISLTIVELYSLGIEYQILDNSSEHLMSSIISITGTFIRLFSLLILFLSSYILRYTSSTLLLSVLTYSFIVLTTIFYHIYHKNIEKK